MAVNLIDSNDITISKTGDNIQLEKNFDVPEVVNSNSDSTANAYSCDYVNKLNTYSTTEQRIGTWIDGKPLYRKVYDFGSAPNNTTKTLAANITNLSAITKIYGFATTTAGYVTPLPQVVANGQNQIQLFFNNNNVSITTTSDKSTYYCYVILEYTKTTD